MSQKIRIALACLCLTAGVAHAAEWVRVASDRGKRVEVDRATVVAAEQGRKVAWVRSVLLPDDAAQKGYYMVKTLNRYDCKAKSVVTVKRVYLREDMSQLREEKATEGEQSITGGSVDDKLLAEVCKPPGAREIQKIAEEAAAAARGLEQLGKPGAQARRGEAKTADPIAALQRADFKPERLPARGDVRRVSDDAPPPAPKLERRAAPAADPEQPPHHVERSRVTRSEMPEPRPKAKPRLEAAAPRPMVLAHNAHQGAGHGAPSAAAAQHKHIHWSYEGEAGPTNWGALKPEFAKCASGSRQSPIDIRDGIRVGLEDIRFDYRPSYFRIVDNGHTIQVNYGPGSTMSVGGRTYELVQFHFHRPSEERVQGRAFDMVAHLVHRDPEGRLAVVAVLLDRGREHPLIQTLWANLPLEKHDELAPEVAIDVTQLLPEQRGYYTYMGSLTTPPCTEGVLWLVMKTPAQVSPEQINIFARFYRNNARPIQAVQGRTIKESR